MSGSPPRCVVLVEPAGPLNVGSVARLCANFAITDLRLVAPRCDPSDPDALRMAVHGRSVLTTARIYPTLLAAVSDCSRVVATAGRLDHGTIPLGPPELVLPWAIRGVSQQPIALVFGREDHGLTNAELLLSQRVITLHSCAAYPSLNLSHAVAVVLHEIARLEASAHPTASTDPTANTNPTAKPLHAGPARPDPEPAGPKALEACLNDAEDLLMEVGFLLEHTARARMAKVRGLLQRGLIRSDEVALLRGMVRQLRWAVRQHRP
ncbi:MAG: RNA methyltransferase [Synechococcus sp.]